MKKETKKNQKSYTISPESSPQEYLAMISDSGFISQLEESINHHLSKEATLTPLHLRKRMNKTTIVLGTPAVIDDDDYADARQNLEVQVAILTKLKQYGIIKDFKYRRGDFKNSVGQFSMGEEMIFADVNFYPADVISYYEEINKHQSNDAVKTSSGELEFDELNSSIHYGKNIYSFQRKREDKTRLLLFKTLWANKIVYRNGQITKAGKNAKALPVETVAVQVELVDSSHDFNRAISKRLNALIKNLNTSLKRKNMPIKINKKGGVQIEIKI